MSILEALVDPYKSELKYRVSILEALVDSYKSEVKDVNPRGIGGFIQVRGKACQSSRHWWIHTSQS